MTEHGARTPENVDIQSKPPPSMIACCVIHLWPAPLLPLPGLSLPLLAGTLGRNNCRGLGAITGLGWIKKTLLQYLMHLTLAEQAHQFGFSVMPVRFLERVKY